MARDSIEYKTVKLQTKVSPESYAILENIAKKYGFSIFQLLRMFADTIIRYMDDRHNLSEDIARVMRMFENIPGWKKSICLASGWEDYEVVDALYILRERGKEGERIVWAKPPLMVGSDEWICTMNVQEMVERFLNAVSPQLYCHLRLLKVEMGTESMIDIIRSLANLYMEDPNQIAFRAQNENADWHMGVKMHEENNRKRPYEHTEQYYERQQQLFENE